MFLTTRGKTWVHGGGYSYWLPEEGCWALLGPSLGTLKHKERSLVTTLALRDTGSLSSCRSTISQKGPQRRGKRGSLHVHLRLCAVHSTAWAFWTHLMRLEVPACLL